MFLLFLWAADKEAAAARGRPGSAEAEAEAAEQAAAVAAAVKEKSSAKRPVSLLELRDEEEVGAAPSWLSG